MKLLWLYFFAYLLLPIIGEFSILLSGLNISAGGVTSELIFHNIIFSTMIIIISYLLQKYKSTKIFVQTLYNYQYAKRVFNYTIKLFIFFSLIIFILGGYKILLGLASRGEIRTTLGMFGAFYTLILSYLPVVLIVYSSVIYIHLNNIDKRKLKRKLTYIYSFAIILGLFSGYKAVAITLMIPGFVVLYLNNFGISKAIIFMLLGVVSLTIFTAIVRHEDIISSFYFLIYRMTTMTAYGTVGVWNTYPNGVPITDILINFLGIFGQNISSLVLNLSPHDPDFLKTNLSRLITYKVYPNIDGALAGSVNVTVTNFGHAIYLLGKQFYIFYALIVGIITGLIIRAYRKYIIKGYPLKASLTALYFFAVIIPSINSGGIFILFSFPVLVYFILAYIMLKITLKKVKINTKKRFSHYE